MGIDRLNHGARRAARLFAGMCLLIATATASAQTQTATILVDRDGNGATGCVVTSAGQSMSGIDVRIDATLSVGATPAVLSVTRATCANGSFGASQAAATSAAFGAATGLDGSDVIEFGMAETVLLDITAPRTRLGFASAGSLGEDALFTGNGLVGGPGITLFGDPQAIPGPGLLALLLLMGVIGAVGLLAVRRARRWIALSLFSLLALAGIALAANFVVDGQTGDWSSVPPLASSPASSGSAVDLRAAFVARENGNAYVRIDLFGLRTTTPVFTSANSGTLTVGTAGALVITAIGIPTPTVVLSGGTLPGGIAFNAATGQLTGTAAAGSGGVYPLQFEASNAQGSTLLGFTLTVNEAPGITSGGATTFQFGQPNSFTVTADGFPASTFAIGGDALPSGVSFNTSTGVLSGTPAAATGGTYALTFTATNIAGSSGQQAFTLTVQQGPTFTSAAATTFTVGSAGSFSVTASGTPAPTLELSSGTLPAGVTFNAGSGLLSGTPDAGTGAAHVLEFSATNSAGTVTQTFTLMVNEAPSITSADNTTFDINVPGTFTVTAGGFPAPGFALGSCTPALPNGISLDAVSGVLSGTPVDGQGGSYVCPITASNGVGLAAVQSFTLTINLLASRLDVATQPSATVQSGIAFAQQPSIQLRDADGLAVPQGGIEVTVSIASGGGTLGGTTTATTNASGVATFTGLSITGTVGNRTLAFASTGLTGTTSATISVTAGTASQLTITTEPSTSVQSGAAFAQQPQLQLRDASGNAVVQAGVDVTAAIASGGGTLGGVATVATNAEGVASFTNLSITGTAGDRTLSFSSAGLTGATSATITVISGPPAALQITTQTSSTAQAGVAFAQQPVVRLVDADGNPAAGGGVTIAAAIASGGGTLAGTVTANTNASGVATFADLSIEGTAGNRTLGFSATGLTGATSATIAVGAGPASALSFTVQPSNAVASAPITPAVQVSVVDDFGNVVTAASDSITVAIGSNPSGGTLSGTVTVAATSGVASFPTLAINLVGSGYTLTAASGSLAGATSSAFDVSHGPLDNFLVEATGGGPIGNQLAGTPFNVRVTARDALNNTVANFTGTVGFSSTPSGGISAGATSAAFSAGVLASHGIAFGTPGAHTLTATRISGSESGTSNSFDVQAPPTAVNDGPVSSSVPGNPFHAFYSSSGSSQTFILAAPGILANDNLGFPQAIITSFGAESLGGSVTTYAAGSTVSPLPGVGVTTGSLSVGADGSITFTPPDGFTGNYIFRYRLTNSRGTSDGRVTIAVGARPLAVDDTYSATLVGNVPINTATSSQFNVTANDSGDARVLAITANSNGTAVLSPDGTFSFRPTAGHEGAASFSYTVSNGFGTSAPATVSMTVGSPIWFINAAAAAGGDGSYDTPFNSLATFAAINNDTGNNPAANDQIFLYSGSYGGPLTLLSGQRLIGQGASAALSTIAGVTWPADAGSQPAMSGTPPTLTATNATALTLANVGSATTANNLLRGFNIGTVGATGTALAGTSFGTVTTSELGINTNGRALALATGTVAGGFTTLSSTGGANNVLLTSVVNSGTVTLGSASDALSGATGNAFEIVGGNGSFTYPGSISNTSALAVRIATKTGGTVTLSGSINPGPAGRGIEVTNNFGGSNAIVFSGAAKRISSGASAGVSLTNNPGATVDFTGGGLEIVTTTGAGFTAAGGAGGITVRGANNSISATGGTALNVQNTPIGASGLTFRTIAATGGANGIVLVNTGSAGGLVVTGSGAAGSGGSIINTTGADGAIAGNGVYLSGASAVSLDRMVLTGHSNHGIYGTGVAGFTIANSTVQGNGTNAGGSGEGGVYFLGLTGTSTLSAVTVNQHSSGNGLYVYNTAGTLNMTVTGSTFSNSENDGVLVEADNSAAVTMTVSTTNFSANKGDHVQVAPNNASVVSATITGGTFSGGHPTALGQGITMRSGGPFSGTFTYDIDGITINSSVSYAINTGFGSTTGTGLVRGKIRNNTIGSAGVALSGSAQASCILAETNGPGTGTHTVSITGNTLRGCFDRGVELFGNRDGSNHLNATITGNNINDLNQMFSRHAIHLESGSSLLNETGTICADIANNTMTAATAVDEIRVRLRSATTARFPGYTGATTDAVALTAYMQSRNPSGGSASVAISSPATANNTSPAGNACPTPP
jgi:hypothetical protein